MEKKAGREGFKDRHGGKCRQGGLQRQAKRDVEAQAVRDRWIRRQAKTGVVIKARDGCRDTHGSISGPREVQR